MIANKHVQEVNRNLWSLKHVKKKKAKRNKHVKAKTKQTNKQKFRVSRQWHHAHQNRPTWA